MDFSKTRATRALPSPQFALLGSLELNLKAAGESKRWPPWPGWLPFAHRPPKPHHDSPVQEIFEIRFLHETFLHTYKIRIGGYESLSHPEIASNQIVWFIHDLVILSVDHAIAKGGGYDKFRDHRVLGKASFSLYQYVRIIQSLCTPKMLIMCWRTNLGLFEVESSIFGDGPHLLIPRRPRLKPALTLWVRLPNLPLHFWHEDAILPVVNVVGRFIKLDEKTKNTENYMFARACMEIDLRTPLKRVLVVHEEDEGDLEFNMVSKPVKLYVSYEGIFEVCFECGRHKHKFWECPNKKKDDHSVLVDRAESDNDVEPEELEVDPEIKSLANKEIMLYFPLPIKTDNHMPEEAAKEDLNPPSPA
ncbi:hypothetical protein ACLB2K_034732 [Fragaria x ananassa]